MNDFVTFEPGQAPALGQRRDGRGRAGGKRNLSAVLDTRWAVIGVVSIWTRSACPNCIGRVFVSIGRVPGRSFLLEPTSLLQLSPPTSALQTGTLLYILVTNGGVAQHLRLLHRAGRRCAKAERFGTPSLLMHAANASHRYHCITPRPTTGASPRDFVPGDLFHDRDRGLPWHGTGILP